MSGHHIKFLQRAIALSKEGMEKGVGGPFGAVIVKDGIIVAEGYNQVTSIMDPTAHAEMQVIRKACMTLGHFELKGCTLYTSCEPCPMCFGAIYWSRLDAVYYGNTREQAAQIGFDDDFIYQEWVKPLDARKISMQQLLQGEAQSVFQDWVNKQDKLAY
jgi:guanine deaminase